MKLLSVRCFFLISICSTALTYASSQTEVDQLGPYLSQLKAADTELNERYVALLRQLDSDSIADLRVTQRKWLARRDSRCGLQSIDTTSSAWIESLSTYKKIWCVTWETKERYKELWIFPTAVLKTDPEANICDGIEESIRFGKDQVWIGARDSTTKSTRARYEPPTANGNWGNVILPSGEELHVDVTQLGAFGRSKGKVGVATFDLDGDGVEEFVFNRYLSRAEGSRTYIFKKLGERYLVVQGGRFANVRLLPTYFRGKTYLVQTAGPGAPLWVFTEWGGAIDVFCKMVVEHGVPAIHSNCEETKICQVVRADGRLLLNDVYEIWDKAPRDEEDGKSLEDVDVEIRGPQSVFEEAKKTFVDIDNDGTEELAVVHYNIPPHFNPYPQFMKDVNGLYKLANPAETWNNFTLPKYSSSQGKQLFVKNDGRLNYVVIRERILSAEGIFGKVYKFYIVLAQGKKVKRVGELAARYPRIVSIKYPRLRWKDEKR